MIIILIYQTTLKGCKGEAECNKNLGVPRMTFGGGIVQRLTSVQEESYTLEKVI